MSYEFAWRFWFLANDNAGHPRRAAQYGPSDYPGLMRLHIVLAVLRGNIDLADLPDDGFV